MTADDQRPTASVSDLGELAAFVERIVALAQRAGVSALEIKTDDVAIKLRSGQVVDPTSGPAPATPAFVDSSLPSAGVEPAPGHIISSPMVGTFYHALSPADPPLVQVGDRVEAGQLIGIIEAMKIMNEITADQAGTVLEIMASNATAVEYGSPLIRLGP